MKPELEVALSIIAYSACSGSLVLVNKLILYNLPYPSLVVSFQLVAALIFIFGAKWSKKLKVDEIEYEYVIPYLYYIVAFSMGVYCNMKSLTLSNVETIVVFRALSPCLVSVLDALFLGREYPSSRSITALALIVLGAFGYASFDEDFQTQGAKAYLWPTAYLLVISFEMAYGKKIIKSVDLKTLSGPVLYTNLLGLPPMLVFASLGGEYHKFYENQLADDASPITIGVWLLLLLGCVAGTGIGYAGWWCRGTVSATTFTLVGVLNKVLTILVNYLIWDNHAAPPGIACLLFCLIGGAMYQQAPMRQKTDYESAKPETDDEEVELLKAGTKV